MLTRGSEWRRWEPHVHAPGTVLNDQFGGADPWEPYLNQLETVAPVIEAIGVTDYYVTESYEELVRRKAAGRLPNVQLIFPNIELRLSVAARTGFVNLHLLVSPDDPEHITEIRRFLSRLRFHAFNQDFDCSRGDLIRLGRASNPSLISEGDALAHGATQFKVDFTQLKQTFKDNEWARNNILIAVAGGADDGTSGIRQAADATMRQEIEKFAHIIFASSVAQREFWIGKRVLSVADLRARYDGCKPCLHGSDAHDQLSVGQPTEDRFSWIKGALTFDALRQAYIDPEGRAYVGTEPPATAMPSQVISHVYIESAAWASTPAIPLNPGLVAIIGARGSGKTALADIIAAGCDALPNTVWNDDEDVSPSFLARARQLISDGRVKLQWGGGAETTSYLDGRDSGDEWSFPRARYLSQQFVEELCSAKGASEGLIREIERVVFQAHSQEEREGATNFAELKENKTLRFQLSRKRESQSIAAISDRVADELEKEAIVTTLAQQIAQKTALILGYNADLAKLVVKGTEAQAARHAQLNQAAQGIQIQIQGFAAQRRTFVAMQDEVSNTRATRAPELLREAKTRHAASNLNADQWNDFLLIYKGDVDKALAGYIAWSDGEISKLTGQAPAEGDPNVPLIADNADIGSLPLGLLRGEITRLEKLISADTIIRNQYAALAQRIAIENSALNTLKIKHADALGAADRRKALQLERDAAYGRLFEAIIQEQQSLNDLYAPLMRKLTSSTGTLQKLKFSVARVVDATSWASVAEQNLIDCRKSGPFFGRGSLVKLANEFLKTIWEHGSADQVRETMSAFLSTYSRDILVHAPFAPTQQVEFRAWSKRFAQWLFSTEHISVRYEIAYDGVDIRKLSPGTRGIVLLLLYLALDDADDRPLIIDQPEENLDPKSVFDELVSLFVAAKSRRQVIMVTHNANLVINTDADQIIVASSGPYVDGGLPSISYDAGGLEDGAIRTTVCEILEGGAEAFRERARRLRVRLDR